MNMLLNPLHRLRAAKFTPFPQLPVELRLQVWEEAFAQEGRRIVQICNDTILPSKSLISPLLAVDFESRQCGLRTFPLVLSVFQYTSDEDTSDEDSIGKVYLHPLNDIFAWNDDPTDLHPRLEEFTRRLCRTRPLSEDQRAQIRTVLKWEILTWDGSPCPPRWHLPHRDRIYRCNLSNPTVFCDFLSWLPHAQRLLLVYLDGGRNVQNLIYRFAHDLRTLHGEELLERYRNKVWVTGEYYIFAHKWRAHWGGRDCWRETDELEAWERERTTVITPSWTVFM
ncbi:uncharacterized protein BCR38DRAFT_413041 [Pseudomassariella vexata]|uniref:2EXR domain-containing protein n=1 Tax=Pseudomassariella vexata TaxID=1141098 RepID=A0A1Y2DHJ8_9PEZI|nr:uncharacterized protein BCR38DRAFT_413041 [Pseudomassariella vexata]ORY58722.1 hypothetical protein BCR38DRAFT_413041 [Pseudomassariella vexata]